MYTMSAAYELDLIFSWLAPAKWGQWSVPEAGFAASAVFAFGAGASCAVGASCALRGV